MSGPVRLIAPPGEGFVWHGKRYEVDDHEIVTVPFEAARILTNGAGFRVAPPLETGRTSPGLSSPAIPPDPSAAPVEVASEPVVAASPVTLAPITIPGAG